MQHILQNKFEDESDGCFSPQTVKKHSNYFSSLRRPRRIFEKKMNCIEGFNSEKNVPSMKENFKRIEYKKVVEMDNENEEKKETSDVQK